MIKLICVVLVFFFVSPVSGQTLPRHQADSLLNAINTHLPDDACVSACLKLAGYNIWKPGERKEDLDSAARFLDLASKVNLRIKSGQISGQIYFLKAVLLRERGQESQARNEIRKSIQILQKNYSPFFLGQAYYELSGYYSYENEEQLNKKIDLVEKAIQCFKQVDHTLQEAEALQMMADLLFNRGDNFKAFHELSLCLESYRAIHDKEIQGVYDLFASFYLDQGDLKQALDNSLLSIRTAREAGDTTLQVCEINNRAGVILSKMGQSQKAINYFIIALKVAEKYRDKSFIIVVADNLVREYSRSKKFLEAKMLLDKFSLKYNLRTDKTADFLLADSYLDIYKNLKDFQKGQFYADRVLKLVFTANLSDKNKYRAYKGLIRFYMEAKQFELAIKFLNCNLELARHQRDMALLADNEKIWFELDTTRHDQQSAITHLLKLISINKSMVCEGTTRQLQELQLQFASEQKEKEIKSKDLEINSLEKTNKLQKTNLYQTNFIKNLTIGGLVIILIACSLFYRQFLQKQRANRIIEKKNSDLQDLLSEKEWLLKEVHHRVKNNLQIIISLLNTQSAYLDNSVEFKAMKEFQNRIQAIALIHQKMYSSTNVASISFKTYIADLLEILSDYFDTGKRKIRFEQVVEPVQLDLAQAVPLGLILNEAISNAIKYAFTEKGGDILIDLQVSKQNIVVINIKDNGKGLPMNFDLKTANSLGMKMMKALSKQLGGTLNIINQQGVTLTLEFKAEKEFYNFNNCFLNLA